MARRFSVVLMLWLSITLALGRLHDLPLRARSRARHSSMITTARYPAKGRTSAAPSRPAGSTGGNIRHGRPPRSRYRIASTIRLSGHLRGRPTCEGGAERMVPAAPIRHRSNRLANPSPHGHTAPEWCRSTSLISGSFRKSP